MKSFLSQRRTRVTSRRRARQLARRAELRRRRPAGDRQGSTLLIVIALLALLSLIGVVFYTFAAQERSNAEYFSEGAKDLTVPGLPADIYFNWALEQLIVGPDPSLQQSALWGKRHAILTNLLGRDAAPFSGSGITVVDDGTGNLGIDLDGDGIANPGMSYLLDMNHSPAANGGTGLSVTDKTLYPDPDVDYTYPDINTPFLAYVGQAIQSNGIPRTVVIPSFMRPQYLRSGGNPIVDWYYPAAMADRALMANRSFRPHPDHVVVGSGGVRRFVDDNVDNPVALGLTNGGFPFQPADVADGTRTGQLGVWTDWLNPARDATYELDVSNDGDAAGIKEGIWMDLDFPVQTLPNGVKYVPLFSYTVYDADALLNVNAHGNMPEADNLVIDGSRFSHTQFLSRSAQGLDPSEVNLQWGLHKDPSSLTAAQQRQYELFFNRNFSSPAINRREFSNMEYWFLNKGRPEFNTTGSGPGRQSEVTDLFPGRNGEQLTMYGAIRTVTSGGGATMLGSSFPYPGQSNVDDQNETAESPLFMHPLAYNGLGSYWETSTHYGTPNPKRVDLVNPLGSNPSVWPRYDGYQRIGNFGWNQYLPGNLVTNLTTGAHIDDETERVLSPSASPSILGTDAIFGADGMAWLHLSDADITSTATSHRLGRLLPVSFSQSEEQIRKMFTTMSWDRKQFSVPHWGIRDTPLNANGENTSRDAKRPWEFNRDDYPAGSAPDGKLEFPPTYQPASFTGTYVDPFRRPVRELLLIENGYTPPAGNLTNERKQLRMQLNRLVDRDPNTGDIYFRELTPHPATLVQSDYDNVTANWQQELQARLDRQRMCRDIYVLLYTFCGGRDADPTGVNDHADTITPGNSSDLIYTTAQLREMAQFAVNLVDSLDRDNVITKFEYDKNLGTTVDAMLNQYAGWNVDDDADTGDGYQLLTPGDAGYDANHRQDSLERGVVYGVEAQSLTFSEGLFIRSAQDLGANHNSTRFNDMDKDRFFLFMELRNVLPLGVNLASGNAVDASTGVWRIRRDDNNNGQIDGFDNAFTFLQNAGPNGFAGPIPAGGQFVIGTNDGSDLLSPDYLPSDFRVDYDLDGDYDVVAPFVNEASPPTAATTFSMYPQPHTDLDLVHQRDDSTQVKFEMDNNAATKGAFLQGLDSNTQRIPLVLERRAHTGAALGVHSNQHNGWVEVDRITVDLKVFDPAMASSTQAQVEAELAKLKSWERPQPFRVDAEATFSGPVDTLHYNSLSRTRNNNSPAQFTVWQPHFDRDFSSPVELFGVPLYGAHRVTQDLYNSKLVPLAQAATGPYLAAGRFLVPEDPQNTANRTGMTAMPTNPRLDNRWYRLFEFFEVPPKEDRRAAFALQASNYTYGFSVNYPPRGYRADVTRTPGKINLNTSRTPETLAALLDDVNYVDLDVADTTDSNYLPDQLGDVNRDWWVQFLKAREPQDPVTGLHLPGTAVSRPFRSFNVMNEIHDSLDSTLFRKLPLDAASGNANRNRLLFEAGDAGDHTGSQLDPVLRYRLLSKMYNNTTTRSNVFIVYLTVGFFEAVQDSNGNVRIGNKLADPASPDPPYGHRGFFIVDRSDAEAAYDPNTLQFTNWRALVTHRLTIR